MGALDVTRFALDPSCRIVDGGRVLLGGSPLTLFRLGPAGADVVDAIRSGRRAASATSRSPIGSWSRVLPIRSLSPARVLLRRT